MKPPLFIRALSNVERRTLQGGLRSREAFTLRRAQILLASAEGQRPSAIAGRVGCAVGTVHNTIRAFAREGSHCLIEKKRGPKGAQPILDAAKAEAPATASPTKPPGVCGLQAVPGRSAWPARLTS